MAILNEWLLSIRRTLGVRKRHVAVRSHKPGYRVLVDSLDQALFEADTSGSLIYLNSAWTRLTGFTSRESLGAGCVDFVHPEDRSACHDHLQGVLSGNSENHALDIRLIRREGDSCWVELRAAPIRTLQGHVTGVVGTLNDIVARVRRERALSARHRALENLLDDMPGMAYRCRKSSDWTMEYVSKGSLALTGYDVEQLVNSEVLAYGKLIHKEDRERVRNEVDVALRENRSYDVIYRIETAQGQEKWAWERGKGLYSSTGEVLGLEGFITDVTKIKQRELGLQNDSLYDRATGLPKPFLFADHVQHALEEAKVQRDDQFAVLVLHLGQLAPGLASAESWTRDAALREVSLRLHRVLEPADIASCLDTDRFAIFLNDANRIANVTRVARTIQEQFLYPVRKGGSQIYVAGSLGIALSGPRYQRSDEILRDAEIALNRARALGGGRSEIFDLHVHARAAALSSTERRLQRAIEEDQFSVHWQPVVSTRTGAVVALEARLAWADPQRGLIFSEQYLPMAEATQYIQPLWERMLSEACRQMEAWKAQPWTGDLAVNIQISGNSLLDVDSVLRLGEKLFEVKPRCFDLALGIPAAVLSQEVHVIDDIAKRLDERGIGLVLDDVGADLASLPVLTALPVRVIRLARSLVVPSDSHGKYVEAIAALAHTLEIQVVANGLETNSQREKMRAAGVDFEQGEAISPPVDAAAATAMLENLQAQQH